ncbi:MFS transporter [Pseudomonas sp. MBLB4123]|uniref:MFS transporter n=1 Tax=Pseudomonas benzenivorans TaxID=556533 RepID=A0ABZ0PSR0_9PSED|nr:MFS transporter [Pseudomonas benzenivorans]WPC03727.1 MFS transporter [Pseudomonas benzenivorans]
MIENDYLLAWSAYAVAALGCLLVWFRLTRWMWRFVREPLRLLVAVLLLTPTIVDPAEELFAPAIAITALDLLFKVGNNAWRAVADLALYGLIAFALYLLFVAIRWPIERWWQGRRGPEREAADEQAPTLRELMQRGGEETDGLRDVRGERRLRIEPRL